MALAQQEWADGRANGLMKREQGFNFMTTAQYLSGFNNYTNPEWMWGIKQQDDQGTAFYSFFANMGANYNSSTNRSNPKAINSKLYNLMTATDIRRQLWDPTGTNTDFSRFPHSGVEVPLYDP